MTTFPNRIGYQLIFVVALALLLMGYSAPNGLYNIDEAIYLIGAEALHQSGGFGVENGYDTFGSDDLKLWILISGPNGLVPQYPVGSAVAAAPLIGMLGQKSLVLINILAGIGTLFTTYALAFRLFKSTEVANLTLFLFVFCTFWTEFAVAIWPHSVSIFSVTLATVLFLETLDRVESAWRPAVWSGLVTGLGLFFRLEGALLLPAFAGVAILYAKKPVQVLVGGAAGLLPIMALMAYTNWLRFESLNPLSYGSSGGGTDATNHLGAGIVMLAAICVLMVMRQFGTKAIQRRYVLSVLAVLGLAIALLHPFIPFLQKLLTGIHAIFLDAKVIVDARPGATVKLPDGTMAFWGQPKKALVQSLPWLGALLALLGLRWGHNQRSIVIVLIFISIWSMPFLLKSWHGGAGSNMRYLMPVVPIATALLSWILCELSKRLNKRNLFALPVTAALGFTASLFWALSKPEQIYAFNQITTTQVFYAVAAFSVLAGFFQQRYLTLTTLHLIAASLGLSSYLAFQDYTLAQTRRADNAAVSQNISTIPGPAVFYGPPAAFYSAFADSDRLVALASKGPNELDMGFINEACRKGYRVFFNEFFAQSFNSVEGVVSDYVWPDGIEGPPLMQYNCDL